VPDFKPHCFKLAAQLMIPETEYSITYLINGERSAAFTPLQLSLAEYRSEITRLANVEAG